VEALVTAAAGVLLWVGALAAFEYFAIEQGVADLKVMPWVDWADWLLAAECVAVLGPLVTLVPTLLLTRKYLKV
jgi:cell division transport system permease protein